MSREGYQCHPAPRAPRLDIIQVGARRTEYDVPLLLYPSPWVCVTIHTPAIALHLSTIRIVRHLQYHTVPDGIAIPLPSYHAMQILRYVYSTSLQAVELGSREKLLAFCEAVQLLCPIGSYIKPTAGATAGYESQVSHKAHVPGHPKGDLSQGTCSQDLVTRDLSQTRNPCIVTSHTPEQPKATGVCDALLAPIGPCRCHFELPIIPFLCRSYHSCVSRWCHELSTSGISFHCSLPLRMPFLPFSPVGCAVQVVFADGTFIDGSTIELSCDGPLREPYAVFCQVLHATVLYVWFFAMNCICVSIASCRCSCMHCFLSTADYSSV